MSKVYTQEERDEAMKLAGEIGNRPAAERLGINLDTLYTWQSKTKAREKKREEIKAAKTPEEYAAENERLKKELREKEEEVTILQEALGWVYGKITDRELSSNRARNFQLKGLTWSLRR